jgi:hypothetical protein
MQCILYKIYFWKVFHMYYKLICILYALLCGQNFILVKSGCYTLLVLSKAFDIVGVYSFYKKTPMGIIARLEPSMANSLATSFFPHKICKYSRPSKLFSSLRSSWQYSSMLSCKHDNSLFTWLMTTFEYPRTLSRRMPSAMAILRP